MFKDYFQFAHPTRVVAGREMIGALGFEFAKEGAKRPLIVTDEVIRGTGLIEKAEAGLRDGGLEPAGVFDDVPQDSGTGVVEACAQAARDAGCDSIVAVGGGSVMDTAKVANALYVHGGTVLDYEGIYQLPRTRRIRGRAAAAEAAGLRPDHLRDRLRGLIRGGDPGLRAAREADARGLPALPVAWRSSTPSRPGPCRRRSPPRRGWTR